MPLCPSDVASRTVRPTRDEARLLASLTAGRPDEAAAKQHGISYSTL